MPRSIFKILFVLIVIANVVNHVHAQNRMIDSLFNLLKKDNEDTNKVIHFYNLCWEYQHIGSYDIAFSYGNAALQLGKKLNFPKGIAATYNNIGIIYCNQGDYGKALENHLASLKISEEINDKQGIAASYTNIGLICYNQGKYDKALENYFAALKIGKEIGDKKNIAASYGNIGIIYYEQNKYDKALENYIAALKIQQEIDDKKNIAASYNNIGTIYEAQGKYDKALENYFAALKIQKKTGDKKNISGSYSNIGIVYYEQGNYDKALENYFAALKIKEGINDKKGMADSYGNIGILYRNKNNHSDAIKYFEKELQLSKEIGAKSLIMSAYSELSGIYAEKNDYKNAFEYYQLYSQIKDSIFNEKSGRQMAELQTMYETEKKEKQIKLLYNENEIKALQITEQQNQLFNSRILFTALFAGIILVIVISRLLISRNRKTELLKQQELRTRVIIETQEQERKRIAQDLHDGIGQTLAGIKMNFATISGTTEFVSEENQKIFHQTIKSLDDAYKEVRTLSHSMMPKALKESGLTDAIDDLLEKILTNYTIKYVFEKNSAIRFDEKTEIALYRVFQELLNNILKHSGASEIAVHLHNTKEHVILMVEDNGMGINLDQSNEKKGMGLSNIEARVYALNGTFSINAGAHRGTVAVVRIPVKQMSGNDSFSNGKTNNSIIK